MMFEDTLPLDTVRPPWRPVAEPWRPPVVHKIRKKHPLPGQKHLPGMGDDADSSGPIEQGGVAGGLIDAGTAGRSASQSQPPTGTAACPNCGGTALDSDGDCMRCWEPGVGARHSHRVADA
jgi:hypothetical protein